MSTSLNTPSQTSEARVIGHVDISGNTISGRAVNVLSPLNPVYVTIRLDNFEVARLLATNIVDYRAFWKDPEFDVLDARRDGVAALAAGFTLTLGGFIPRTKPIAIEVFGNDQLLFSQTVTLGEQGMRDLRAMADKAILGMIHVVSYEENEIEISGTIGVPQAAAGAELSLTYNRDPIPATITPSMGLQDVFSKPAWFEVRATLQAESFGEGIVRLNALGLDIPDSAGLILKDGWPERFRRWRFPSAPQITRTTGSASNLLYFFSGMHSAATLTSLIREYGAPGGRVLDWGCGCGRSTQHLIEEGFEVVGIDIDPENVAWCAAHLDRGAFHHIELMPPTRFESAAFDVACAISVFTHLTDGACRAWIREMARLLKPGGLGLFTISSDHALLGLPEPVLYYESLRNSGIDDSVVGMLLNDVLDGNKDLYYRETFISHTYVMQNWSQEFDVLAIRPAAHFNFQDYVILRRR